MQDFGYILRDVAGCKWLKLLKSKVLADFHQESVECLLPLTTPRRVGCRTWSDCMIRRSICFLFLLPAIFWTGGRSPLALAGAAAPQEFELAAVRYRLSMPQPSTHLFQVTIEVDIAGSVPETVDFQMPLWSPGRYASADFAKNVQEFVAGAFGERLQVARADTQTWTRVR